MVTLQRSNETPEHATDRKASLSEEVNTFSVYKLTVGDVLKHS